MAILKADNLNSYADAADMENFGWVVDGETGGTPATVLETTGGPFGTGDYYLRVRESGASRAYYTLPAAPTGDNLRLACWVRCLTPGAVGAGLGSASASWIYATGGVSTTNALHGIGLSVTGCARTLNQWDDASHGMGGAIKINDGEWHHVESYVRVSDTDGTVMLWVDGILSFHRQGDTNDTATSPADIVRMYLTHPDFNVSPDDAHIAHPVMWNDVDDSNSVGGGLIGRIGPHKVENDGSVTTGYSVPTSYDFGFGIGLEPFDFAGIADSNSLPADNRFDITFSDIPAQRPLIVFGFGNTANAYDTVSTHASLNYCANALYEAGLWATTRQCDAIASGSGAALAHYEGAFGDYSSSSGIYFGYTDPITSSNSTLLEIEVGTGDTTETGGRVEIGAWTGLALDIDITASNGNQVEFLAFANEMLEGFATMAGPNFSADRVLDIGFEPDFITVFSHGDSANATGGSFFKSSFGVWAANGGTPAQRCISFVNQASSTIANNDFYHEIADDHVCTQIAATTGAKDYEVACSVSGDQVTLDVDNTNTDVACAIMFKLAGGRQSKLIDFTTPTATGDQAVTGLGFVPGFLWLFLVDDDGALNAVHANEATGMLVSMMRADRQVCLNFSVDPDANPTIAKSYKSEKAIKFYDALAAAVSLEASLVSFDADGFTLNWTTVKGVVNRGYILAIEGDASESSNSLDSNSNSNDLVTDEPIFFMAVAA